MKIKYNKVRKSIPDLSICVTIKNRSRMASEYGVLNIFEKTLVSYREIAKSYNIEIIITDWDSTDHPLLKWIPSQFGDLPIKIININRRYFSRGVGIIVAATYARSKNLLLTDADVVVGTKIVSLALENFTKKAATFPFCLMLENPQVNYGKWSMGQGIAFVRKKWWQKSGGIPEWPHWGWEDSQFFYEIKKFVETRRPKLRYGGLIHQWHPVQREHYKQNSGTRMDKRRAYFNEKRHNLL